MICYNCNMMARKIVEVHERTQYKCDTCGEDWWEENMQNTKAIVLLSGGLDSATVAGIVDDIWPNSEKHALSFIYGQKHARELESAKSIAAWYKMTHHIIQLPNLEWLNSSALVGENVAVPTARSPEEMEAGVAPTYVPGRNTIMLAIAFSLAEAIQAHTIWIGINEQDYSGYPDCRHEYVHAFNEMLKLASSKDRIIVHYPLVFLSKKEIVESGTRKKVPYELTWSCYQGGEAPCGECDSCILRAKGFAEAGIEDPLLERISK